MIDETQPQTQTQDTREYTLAELDAARDAGQITPTQRDQIWTNQVQRAAVKQAEAAARTIVETETRTNNVDAQLKEYATIAPDLMGDTSLRQRVAAEFDFLVSQGAPKDLTTELAAVRGVLGPIERARSFAQGRRRGPDGFADTANAPMSPQQKREADAWSRIDAPKRAYYEKQINAGLYANKAAVLAEINWRRGANNNRGTA